MVFRETDFNMVYISIDWAQFYADCSACQTPANIKIAEGYIHDTALYDL